MRQLAIFSTVLVFSALLTSHALACRVGGDQVLFDVPPAHRPANTHVIQGYFTNSGSEFDKWHREVPASDGGELIGILTDTTGLTLGVYHPVTSCTHGFFGTPKSVWGLRAFLVGRSARTVSGKDAFYAAGDWNGRWVNVH